jgi:hypothetical protein
MRRLTPSKLGSVELTFAFGKHGARSAQSAPFELVKPTVGSHGGRLMVSAYPTPGVVLQFTPPG